MLHNYVHMYVMYICDSNITIVQPGTYVRMHVYIYICMYYMTGPLNSAVVMKILLQWYK